MADHQDKLTPEGPELRFVEVIPGKYFFCVSCPVCLSKASPEEMEDAENTLLEITCSDFDELNWVGSLELICPVCHQEFTTGEIHLYTKEEFYTPELMAQVGEIMDRGQKEGFYEQQADH